MDSWHSYPKVYALGHPTIEHLFDTPVLVEEKVDGSQFSFGIFGGELRAKSRNKDLVLDAPDQMFSRAVETVKRLAPLLHDGWTYRGEYLQKPHHNALTYDRVPKDHIILFDINVGLEKYLGPEEKRAEAERLGLECVPCFATEVKSFEDVKHLLTKQSVLGGATVEGVVFKQYHRFALDGKALLGKYVREEFKEIHAKEWKTANPKQGDIIALLAAKYTTPARWDKAVQHLRDRGELKSTPADIGNLIKETQADVESECAEEIKDALYAWASKQVLRMVVSGLPEWYREKLAKAQFEKESP